MTDAETAPRTHNETIRTQLLDAALAHAAFDGWSSSTFKKACEDTGLSTGDARNACPGGELGLISFWSRQLDRQAARKIVKAELARMKIRERVTFGVLCRLEAIAPHEEAARRARARLLLPDAATEAPKLLWATADTIWRAIGDTSTDANFYSKRAILSGVYGTTLSSWLNEDSADKPQAREFLDRRIQNVMDFEKTKGQVLKLTADLPDIGGFLGKLRYGPGPRI
ncbi:COQ9 family protein [Maricaulis sp.]|uniref:COQ9 family protein n=1 Tax=Maricaulis sp. TaxID=1486257 RepID=UPI003A9462EC